MFEKKLIIFDLQGTLLKEASSYDAAPVLFEGVKLSLATLKKQGYQLAIATACGRSHLTHILSHFDIASYFDQSVCANETRPKPDPLMLKKILETLKLKPAEAVLVGDTIQDFQMGRAMGMDVIAVGYGIRHYTEEDLKTYHVYDTIDTPEALLAMFQGGAVR